MRPLWLAGLALTASACSESGQPTAPAQTNTDAAVAAARQDGARLDLGTLGGTSSAATDINNQGVVVGGAQTATGAMHAFQWTPGRGMVDLGTLPGDAGSFASAINARGDILGVSSKADGASTIVLWTNGQIHPLARTPLGDSKVHSPSNLNNQGPVVGTDAIATDFSERAWLWDPQQGTIDIGAQLPVPFDNGASAVNGRGLVVGTQVSTVSRAFLWSLQAGPQVLGVPGDNPERTPVHGIGLNDAGHVVGTTAVGLGTYSEIPKNPYLWTPGSGFQLMLPTRSATDCCHFAEAINDQGTVVGASSVETPEFAVTAVAWPTPDRIVALNGADASPSVALAINAADVAVGSATTDAANGISHATLWRVRDISASTPAVTARLGTSPKSPRVTASASGRPSLAACLSDSKALRSRPSLVGCIARSLQ
jgi:probable HAF family extracellular repeat protein